MADILVVDDETDIREQVAGILEDEGHRCRLARDSDEALRSVEERRPQIGGGVAEATGLEGGRREIVHGRPQARRAAPKVPHPRRYLRVGASIPTRVVMWLQAS